MLRNGEAEVRRQGWPERYLWVITNFLWRVVKLNRSGLLDSERNRDILWAWTPWLVIKWQKTRSFQFLFTPPEGFEICNMLDVFFEEGRRVWKFWGGGGWIHIGLCVFVWEDSPERRFMLVYAGCVVARGREGRRFVKLFYSSASTFLRLCVSASCRAYPSHCSIENCHLSRRQSQERKQPIPASQLLQTHGYSYMNVYVLR